MATMLNICLNGKYNLGHLSNKDLDEIIILAKSAERLKKARNEAMTRSQVEKLNKELNDLIEIGAVNEIIIETQDVYTEIADLRMSYENGIIHINGNER